MNWTKLFAAGTIALLVAAGTEAFADAPAVTSLVINGSGRFLDKGMWQYKTADGKYIVGPTINGTNELLVMPPPSAPAGGVLSAVEIAQHPFDTLGYPLHISLVDKVFANSYRTTIYVAQNGQLWALNYGTPVADERSVTGDNKWAFKAWGPYHGDAVPLMQAPESDIRRAFQFAKSALNSIINVPESQKHLANYGVLFIDDGNTVWVELGPRFAPNEAPHLGCQTQLGRDMVFGYDKNGGHSKGHLGKFLQCF